MFRFIDLFAGLGGIRIPFEELGGECVFSSEWDAHAQKMYEANFNEKPSGDITKIPSSDIPEHDVLLAGFPCQPFSIMGDKKGFQDTRGTLFFEIQRILEHHKPRAFLLENVKQLVTHNNGQTLQTILTVLRDLGYHVYYKVLNALDFGVPQRRERIIIVGFKEFTFFQFPQPLGSFTPLSSILEDGEIDQSLYASEHILNERQARVLFPVPNPSIWHQNKSGNISALPYSCALRAGASYNYLLVNGERRLSAREMFRLQGFPDTYKIVVNYTQARKQAGNSVCVPVIRAVAQAILASLEKQENSSKSNLLHPEELIA
jgi:DNA (cytosine-5)-methyltransferase 1